MIWALLLAACDPAALPNPLLSLEPMDKAPFVAAVDEVLDAGGYAYLRTGDRWIATLNDDFSPGQRVVVQPRGHIHPYTSRRLDRTFDDVIFAAVDVAP